jgi:hypothetical protein
VLSPKQRHFLLHAMQVDHSGLSSKKLRLRRSIVRAHEVPAEPGFAWRIVMTNPKGMTMRLTTIAVAGPMALLCTFAAYAQSGAPSGRGSTTGDPAASSATPGTSPTTGSSMQASPSGSGTSTSGGKDDNDDQGRDKMPDSSQGVTPYEKQHKSDKR